MRLKTHRKLSDNFKSLGVGIMGMRQRLQQLGGNLEIESDENGTLVRATVPLEVKHYDSRFVG